jgi:hypothetical protein
MTEQVEQMNMFRNESLPRESDSYITLMDASKVRVSSVLQI